MPSLVKGLCSKVRSWREPRSWRYSSKRSSAKSGNASRNVRLLFLALLTVLTRFFLHLTGFAHLLSDMVFFSQGHHFHSRRWSLQYWPLKPPLHKGVFLFLYKGVYFEYNAHT